MKHLVILKTGRKIDSLAGVDGDYEDWIRDGMGLLPEEVMLIDAAACEALPPAGTISGVVITGSGDMVTDAAAWMERSALWLREVAEQAVPILGICFGHQLLAHALGGRVDNNPRGVEVGTMKIELKQGAAEDELFGALPEHFPAQLSHTQSVLELPPGARLLAASEMEPHQAFAWGACAWGIQFHPEFDEVIIPHFIEYYRQGLERVGRDVDRLLSQVGPSPESGKLLQAFRRVVQNRMSDHDR